MVKVLPHYGDYFSSTIISGLVLLLRIKRRSDTNYGGFNVPRVENVRRSYSGRNAFINAIVSHDPR